MIIINPPCAIEQDEERIVKLELSTEEDVGISCYLNKQNQGRQLGKIVSFLWVFSLKILNLSHFYGFFL